MLNSERVEYLLVGGYAVSYHGYPRPTGDLDIWIALDTANAARVLKALEAFGFGATGATSELFMTPGRIVRMGVPPLRIEVLNSVSGVDFAQCYARSEEAVLGGVPVRVIGRQDLLTNKRAAGRAKDLNDIEQLESRTRG